MVESVTFVAVVSAALAYEAKNRAYADAVEKRRSVSRAVDELQSEVLLSPSSSWEDIHLPSNRGDIFKGRNTNTSHLKRCGHQDPSLRSDSSALPNNIKGIAKLSLQNKRVHRKTEELDDDIAFTLANSSFGSYCSCEPSDPDDLIIPASGKDIAMEDHFRPEFSLMKRVMENEWFLWKVFRNCISPIP
uniref:Uncharacterized protein n=1 Tax=Corethron hystrix TaxID=216773 RepID=A0A7S1BHM8_9STRA|mmetsp:Transcript_25618/g.59112  ORF Transcript_25618/g.59112 Transcript_25618/m.59112 type:complete len:189 (+) Transcript_25618:198-764(+)